MVMRIFSTLKRFFRILFLPRREWISIDNDFESIKLIIKYYAWPFIVLSAVLKAVTVFLKFSDEAILSQFKIPFSLTILLFSMLAPLFVILVGGSLIGRISKSMGGAGKKNNAYRLLIYSCTPIFLVMILVNADLHIQYVQYMGLFSIYSAVLFLLGVKPLLELPSEHKFGLLIYASMILSFLFFIVMFITRISINLLYPEGVILFL